MQKRLENLIARIEAAETSVRGGKAVDLRALDTESIAIQKALKLKPDASVKPLLMRAVSAIEKLTAAMEDRVADLKSKKR